MIAVALVTQPVTIFFIVLVIILLAPLLLNKIKIPHIIGMIVAGIIVGPHGFNILANDDSFEIFGQVGLLYLMFLAGLEIDMYHLRLNLRRGVLFGLLTLVVPLMLGVFSSVWILHLDWPTSFLLGSMYASHTLISYPVAARLGITRSPAVLISIVGTIIAVIGALLVLAATVNIEEKGVFDVGGLLLMLGKLACYCAVVLYAYPRLTRMFFKRYSDKVTQYVFVMAMVFLCAIGAQSIGMAPVLGAFFAGLVLNRYIPIDSPLMSSIEFVGNALFIPYFLISVGLMINMRVVLDLSTLYVSALMLSVAIAGKWIPAFIAQKVNGLSKHSRGVMFGLTTAHTAVALAVVSVGYNMGLLNEQVLNSTILVILVTCAAAPIFTSASAAKLKIEMMESEEEGAGSPAMLKHDSATLIPLASPILVQSLVELAILMRNDRGSSKLYALHVRNDNSPASRAVSRNSLEEAGRAAAAADTKIETLDRYDINTVTGVLNAINERDITEIILGMHRRSTVIDTFFGSKIEQLLDSTNKMLIISRCFIPLNAVTRIVVWVPKKAEYETGFSSWVCALARLTHQIGCRVIFCCSDQAQPLIRGVLYQGNYGIRCEFRTVEQWDDFILMSNKILDDDLFVVIGARVNSLSYDSTMVEMPQFLQKYFQRNNLLVIYPEQFGDEVSLPSFVDPRAADIVSAPSPLILRLRGWLRSVSDVVKTRKRKKSNRIDI
ncbi:MAG: cation:proton antiporter [Muribaculaceae bacterium]|nr:cation:proton antiporter [Muribaculaceae bacterium]